MIHTAANIEFDGCQLLPHFFESQISIYIEILLDFCDECIHVLELPSDVVDSDYTHAWHQN